MPCARLAYAGVERGVTESRDTLIHCARVYLAEAQRRRGTAFAHTLLEWAGNCRRRVMALPRQGTLFA